MSVNTQGMTIGIRADQIGKRLGRPTGHAGLGVLAALVGRSRPVRKDENELWALRRVSFEVRPGEALGVVGPNGAGKSTLLNVVAGLHEPDEGSVEVRGRLAGLLDPAAGLHPDLTGAENARTGSIVAGLSRSEAEAAQNEIFEFAELTDQRDQPVRTYSSGMRMRLAFSIAIHVEPEVLVIDEHFSVGDLAFRQKCLSRIRALKENGCCILLAANQIYPIQELCDRALWLDRGEVEAVGPVDEVLAGYASASAPPPIASVPTEPASEGTAPVQRGLVRIAQVELLPAPSIASGDSLAIGIGYEVLDEQIEKGVFSVRISDQTGRVLFACNTGGERPVPSLLPSGRLWLEIERLDLLAGSYYVDVGVHQPSFERTYDYRWHRHRLEVTKSGTARAALAPPIRWRSASSDSPHEEPPG